MEENNTPIMDERTMILNKGIGIVLVLAGIYGLFYAYKISAKTNNMDKKIIIGFLVITGIAVGYYFYNKKSAVVKKDYNDKRMASKKEGLDFYNQITKEGQWSYSTQGIDRFAQAYSESVTKGNHNRMMDIFANSKDKRSADDSKFIDDNFNSVVSKLTMPSE